MRETFEATWLILYRVPSFNHVKYSVESAIRVVLADAQLRRCNSFDIAEPERGIVTENL